MVLVLLALCAYFAVVTHAPQEPSGAEAGAQVARRILSLGHGTAVMLVSGTTDVDARFLAEAERLLAEGGARVVSKVSGEPRDARVELERLAAASTRISAIGTTAECRGWSLLQRVPERFPALGGPSLVVAESYRWPTFLTRQNLLNVANQIVVVAILAVGMTVVIITGGIDLSVGSLVALSAVVAAALVRDLFGGVAAGAGGVWVAGMAAVGLCSAVGAASGSLVAAFRVPPFIATLAVMQVASGLAFIVAKGGSIYELPDVFTWLGRGTGWRGLPHTVVLMVALYVVTHLMMIRTVLGRRIYAVGDNPEAARLSGVPVGLVMVFAYAFSGAMAGLAGVVQASQLKSGAPTYGLMYELYAIAAVVVGGTSLSGGRGTVTGTLVGAFIIAVIQNGMNLTGVESYQQKVVLGLVILGAVLLDLLKQRDWTRVLRAFGFAGGLGRGTNRLPPG